MTLIKIFLCIKGMILLISYILEYDPLVIKYCKNCETALIKV